MKTLEIISKASIDNFEARMSARRFSRVWWWSILVMS